MRGRPNKPVSIKKIQGTYRKGEEKNFHKYPELFTSDAPEGLTNGAKDVWKMIVPQLLESGVIKIIDSSAFMILCTEMATYWECTDLIAGLKEDGKQMTDEKMSRTFRNIYLTRKESYNGAVKIMQDYRLTAASRQKLIVQDKPNKKKDPFLDD